MSFLSNLKLAREDDEILVDSAAEPAEIDVTEAIQAEEDALEVQETEAAIEEEQGEIEVQSEVVEELQEQDAAIEEKLETPAEVTPEDVAVAQEAFAFTLGRLAGNSEVYKSYKSMKVSYEDAKTDPVSALKLHQEGVKEMAAKVWDSIKVMFQKIVAFFKKMWIKIPAMFTNYVKKAEALKGQVNALDASYSNKDGHLEASKKHLKPFAAVIGVSKLSNLFEEAITKTTKISEDFAKQIEKATEETSTKAVENFIAKLTLKPSSLVDLGENQKVVVLGLTNDGIVCVNEKGESLNASVKDFNGDLKNGAVTTIKGDKAELIEKVETLSKMANNKDQALKSIDALFKTVETSVNNSIKKGISEGQDAGQEKAKILRSIIIKLPNACLKSYLVICKSLSGYISECLSNSKGSAAKEEKKEESK